MRFCISFIAKFVSRALGFFLFFFSISIQSNYFPSLPAARSRWTHFEHAQHRLAVSPDGRMLACASAELSLLDTQSRAIVRACVGGHATPVTRMCFAADSRRLVTGAADRCVCWSRFVAIFLRALIAGLLD